MEKELVPSKESSRSISRVEGIRPSDLLTTLYFLGNVNRTKFSFDPNLLVNEIKPYGDDWKQYNPRKFGFNRFGLSLTSLDGGMSGIPDLDSLLEYNAINGTDYNEGDFRTPTELLRTSKSLQGGLVDLLPHLGRSHIINLKKGGFFPPHRDSYHLSPNVFRLFAMISGTEDSYKFLIDDKNYYFQPGKIYLFNSMLAHSVFSFSDYMKMLVLNVDLTPTAVKLVLRNIMPT